MLDFNFRPSASVVICSYTELRWDLLMDVIDSVHAELLPAAGGAALELVAAT